MPAFKIYVHPEDFNYVIKFFLKPYLNELIGNRPAQFVFQKERFDDFPNIRVEFRNSGLASTDLRLIKKSWKSFFKQNLACFKEKSYELEASIFKGHPTGHFIQTKETFSTNPNFWRFSRISSVSAKVISNTYNQDEERRDKIFLDMVFVVLYSMEGFTLNAIKQRIKELESEFDFSEITLELIDKEVQKIVSENKGYLESHVSDMFEELAHYHKDGLYPSHVSELKVDLGRLVWNISSSTIADNKEFFLLVRNQLDLSDAESLCLLRIIDCVIS